MYTERFSRLVMRTDVKDRFISETFSFKNNCVEKACLVTEISAVNLIVGCNISIWTLCSV